MTDIVDMLNGMVACPKCHHSWPCDAAFWHHAVLPMGNDSTFVAALCRACTDSGPNRKQVSEHKTILRADKAGKITAVFYNMSPSGWIPPTPKEFLYDYSNSVP